MEFYDFAPDKKRHSLSIEVLGIFTLAGDKLVSDMTRPADCYFVITIYFELDTWYIAFNGDKWSPLRSACCSCRRRIPGYTSCATVNNKCCLIDQLREDDPRSKLNKGDKKIIKLLTKWHTAEIVNG